MNTENQSLPVAQSSSWRATCKNCGKESEFTPIFAASSSVAQCRDCESWTYTGDVSQAPAELYDESYFNGREYLAYEKARSVYRKNFKRKLDILLKTPGLPKVDEIRLLEVGCASGEFLDVARASGVKRLLGLEVSDYGRKLASQKGLKAISPLEEGASNLIKEFCPNVVVAWDVWEHLESPVAIFDETLRACDPNVTVAVSTVDAGSLVPRLRGCNWRQFHPPTHLNYPTRMALKNYLQSRHFSVVTHNSFGYYRPLADYVGALFGRRDLVVGFPLLFRIPLYLNLYDIQLIVARRTAAT